MIGKYSFTKMKVKWKEQTSRDIFEFYQKNVSKKSKVLKFEGENTLQNVCEWAKYRKYILHIWKEDQLNF